MHKNAQHSEEKYRLTGIVWPCTYNVRIAVENWFRIHRALAPMKLMLFIHSRWIENALNFAWEFPSLLEPPICAIKLCHKWRAVSMLPATNAASQSPKPRSEKAYADIFRLIKSDQALLARHLADFFTFEIESFRFARVIRFINLHWHH